MHFLLSSHSVFVQHRVLFEQCSIAACTGYLHSGELVKRLCAGRRGLWKAPVILRTVGHEHFQAVTHPLARTTVNAGQGQCPAFNGLPLSPLIYSKEELMGAEEILCKLAKFPNIGIEVLEISTKTIVVKIL